MTNAHLYVYNVGHGVCTMLIGDKDDGTKYCGVFDCGTKASNKNLPVSGAVSDMVAKIRAIGHIDNIVISHQDSDHHSELFNLIKQLNGIAGNKFGIKDRKVWVESASRELKMHKFLIYEHKEDMYYYEHKEDMYYRKEISCQDGIYFTGEIGFYKNQFNDFWYTVRNQAVQLCQVSLEIYDETNNTYSLSYELPAFSGREDNISSKDIFAKLKECIISKVEKNLGEIIEAKFNYLAGIISTGYNEILSNLNTDNINAPAYSVTSMIFGGDYIDLQYRYLIDIMQSIQELYNHGCTTGSGYIRLSENGLDFRPEWRFANIVNRDEISNFNAAVKRNSTSVVTQYMVCSNYSVLFPGDATVHTFDRLKLRLDNPQGICMMIAPHHSSDHTNISYTEVGPGQIVLNEHQPLRELLQSFNGCTVAVSSKNNDDHPGGLFMRDALKYAYGGVGEHYIEGLLLDEATKTISYKKNVKINKAVYTNVSTENKSVYDYPLTGGIPQPAEEKREYYKRSEIKDIPSDDCFI